MKYPIRPYLPPIMTIPGDGSFTQGFVASACISAFQGVTPANSRADLKRVLRHALQGGTALAAGSRAAVAIHHRDYAGALLATAAGAVGVLFVENLLREPVKPQKEASHE